MAPGATMATNGYTRDMFVEKPAYDWEADKRSKPVYDDGTTTFFW